MFPAFLYAATEVGIFASADAGATWFPTNQGPANVAVYELFWMDRVLVAATHGRGIFWIDLSAVPAATPPVPPVPVPSAAGGGPAPGSVANPAVIVPTDPTNSR